MTSMTERLPDRSATVAAVIRLASLTLLLFAAVLASAMPARADDDLPGRVGRVANLAGEVFVAPQDNPEQWTPVGINYPVTGGDNLWVGNEGRAEIDFGGGQFRLAGDTNLHLSRLDDRQFALFVAQGRVSVRIRVLEAGESAYVDTPNAQLVLTRPGLYRIDVSEGRDQTRLTVREGEANVQTGGAVAQVLPGQTAVIDGADARHATVRNGMGSDGFDTWVASRDRRYERSRSTQYVSRQMVGYADLDEYGTWDRVPEYGAVWYPSNVAADWAPYRNGYWTEVGNWGPTWVDYAPWGYAPFHYGRWAYIGGRWGWCPGAFVARPLWAPALVGWAGGPGWGFSVTVGSPVFGWVPLGWGEPYRPWWGRCSHGCWDRYNKPYAVNVAERHGAPPTRYVNWNAPGGLSAVPGAAFIARKPVQQNLVQVPANMSATAPVLTGAPIVRAEPGRIPGRRPGDGAPPPASTFYPTIAAKPAVPGMGMGSPVPGAGSVAVPPAARPVPVVPATPAAIGRPTQALPSAVANTPGIGMGAPGVSAPPAVRPAPQSNAPGNPGYAAVPPARTDARPMSRPAPSATYVAPAAPVATPAAPPQVQSALPPANQIRQPARNQGLPLPQSLAPQQPIARPAPVAPPVQSVVRAPSATPVAVAPQVVVRPGNPPQAAPVSPPAGGNQNLERSRRPEPVAADKIPVR